MDKDYKFDKETLDKIDNENGNDKSSIFKDNNIDNEKSNNYNKLYQDNNEENENSNDNNYLNSLERDAYLKIIKKEYNEEKKKYINNYKRDKNNFIKEFNKHYPNKKNNNFLIYSTSLLIIRILKKILFSIP